jgi:putative solute:sodium symporter small subunit
VTTEVPETGLTAHSRHQLRTLIVAVTILSAVLLAVSATILYATALNQFWFLHFPLGFYLLAQGLLIAIVVMTFWYVRVQERIDHARSVSEEIV